MEDQTESSSPPQDASISEKPEEVATSQNATSVVPTKEEDANSAEDVLSPQEQRLRTMIDEVLPPTSSSPQDDTVAAKTSVQSPSSNNENNGGDNNHLQDEDVGSVLQDSPSEPQDRETKVNHPDPINKNESALNGSSETDLLDREYTEGEEKGHVVKALPKDGGGSLASMSASSLNGEAEKLWPGRYTDAELQSIIRGMPEPKKNSHVDSLFGLFLQFSATELESLANSTGLRLAGKPRKRRRQGCDRPVVTHEVADKNVALGENSNDAAAAGGAFPASKKQRASLSVTFSPPVIALVPLALSGTVNKESEESTVIVAPSTNTDQGIVLKRADHESLTMRALEAKVLSKFEGTPTGKRAISTENPLYTKFLSSTDKISAGMSHPMAQQTKRKFTTMPLKYNECSMTAFAKWALGPDGGKKKGGSPKRSSTRSEGDSDVRKGELPSSSVLFHLCQVCDKWGHYEVECELVASRDRLSEVANEVNAQKRLRELRGQEQLSQPLPDDVKQRTCGVCNYSLGRVPTPYKVCYSCGCLCHCGCLDQPWDEDNGEQEWLCKLCTDSGTLEQGMDSAVDVEGCDGFVIEQRKLRGPPSGDAIRDASLSKSMGISFGESSWSKAVCIANEKHMTDFMTKQTDVDPASLPNVPAESDKKHAFSVGEFCWAKRSHTGVGKLARLEWWPAQVINQITDPRSFQYFGETDMTPYLVKFFAIPRASRVRASHVLPFFHHFRAVGYGRIAAARQPLSDTEARFRGGVNDVVGMLGYKSIKALLDHSDEIVSGSQEAARKRKRPKKSGIFTTWFKEDQFTIRAKESNGLPRAQDAGTKDMGASPCQKPVKTYSRTKLVGCIVSWMSTGKGPDITMHVGAVVAANVDTKMALVSPIPGWKEKLRSPTAEDKVVVCQYEAAATEWMPMSKLHMLANGPNEGCKEEITKEITTKLLEGAQCNAVKDAKAEPSNREELLMSLRNGAVHPFEIEAILKERNSYAGREYLVKWKSLGVGHATWKPEKSIVNKKCVLLYKIDQLINVLSLTEEMKEKTSTTYRVVSALQAGRRELESHAAPGVRDSPFRYCPFCDDVLQEVQLFDHVKTHQGEKNYAIIREAARLAQMRWYQPVTEEG